MKSIKFLILALLCAVAQGAWAQSPTAVSTDDELRAAIANDGANIIVTADIDLSNSTLVIGSNKTVTIDLGGHTLDRGLTSRDYDHGGQVITVRSGATLILSNGTLRGGWGGAGGALVNEGGMVTLTDVITVNNVADDRGGGICNREGGTLTMNGGVITNNHSNDQSGDKGGGGFFNEAGATATLTGVTITGNEATVCGGGGICNFGTLTLDGCILQNNAANTYGGGIWQEGTLNMQGTNTIKDNWKTNGIRSNLYLKNGTVITITGALADSHVFVDMETLGTFTSGYSTYHRDIHPAGFFTADKQSITGMRLVNGEAQLDNAIPEGGVYYIERSWNETAKRVEATFCTLEENQYTTLTGGSGDTYLDPGWYVVKGSDVVYNDFLYMNDGGEYHLILCDGASLKAEFFIVNSPNVLHIHGQANDTGKMSNTFGSSVVYVHKYHAGIGGYYDKENGTIVIHGGDIDVHGGDAGPGIGNRSHETHGDPITIYGGTVHAKGGRETGSEGGGGGAGIGGGWNGDCGIVNIYGGSVYATGRGNSSGGAGIGSGSFAENSGTITIYGGYVEATGDEGGAGIGSGYGTNGADVTIHGGTVKAYGKAGGPGIGAGVTKDTPITTGTLTVTGGKVYAYGASVRGAGIGGGYDTNGSDVTVSGGYVYAEGGKFAAGIGSGCEYSSSGSHGGTLIVTGGYVEAHGGEDGAGIGGGEDGDGATVNISGGEVRAYGNDYGAGIGGGENGNGGNVTITGGIVVAQSGGDQRAIGAGYGSTSHGSLNLAENLGVFVTTNLYRSEKDNRVVDCRNFSYVRINQCAHGNATFIDNGSSVGVDCPYCYASTMPYTFNANGNWNDGSKWFAGFMPHEGKDVAVKARATIPNNCIANVGNIALQDGGSLTIADGGQLIHSNAGVTATVQKSVSKYTVSQTSGETMTNGWYFIASPVCTSHAPEVAMLNNTYDLYRLNNTTWENWKQEGDHYHFDLENSHGYLYANSEDVTLKFTGTVLPSANSKNVSVDAGFNLIGNPLLHNVYADRVYYKMNDERTGIIAVENYQENPITPCTGVIVNADAAGTVIFTKEAPSLSNNNGSLNIVLSQVPEPAVAEPGRSVEGPVYKGVGVSTGSTTATLDNAIVSFNEGNELEKFVFNANNAQLYIPQGGKDYAIAFSEGQGEIPLNFKATENGEYTITVNPQSVDLAYLHLIDNMTGADVDLLVPEPVEGPASYTFTAKTTDYESRFKLVFSASGDADDGNEDVPFAFISNSNIIVNGTGTLQIIDVLGRELVRKELSTLNSQLSTLNYTPGVYVLRLINGNDVKTQKIIIQ